MKVALVYDRVNKFGGAERVLVALHKLFPDAPLFTAVYDKKRASWAKVFEIKPSFLQRLPFLRSRHEYIPFLMPFAFESFNFDGFDVVISVTSAEAKGIITKPETLHICCCLTPTRYLWSHRQEYFGSGFFSFITKPIVSAMQQWDRVAATRPDVYVSISKEVASRIKRYYDKPSEVIYPPVDTEFFKPSKEHKRKDFYLIVSRLVAYKRVDLAIEACNKLKRNLVVVGEGSEVENLKRLAGPTVSFLGNLTDAQLLTYYQDCRALIFPQKEDFGLVAVEAQLCGSPVIGYNRGGAVEIVQSGKTGELFTSQTIDSLTEELQRFEKRKYDSGDCRQHALQFGLPAFNKSFSQLVTREYKQLKETRYL